METNTKSLKNIADDFREEMSTPWHDFMFESSIDIRFQKGRRECWDAEPSEWLETRFFVEWLDNILCKEPNKEVTYEELIQIWKDARDYLKENGDIIKTRIDPKLKMVLYYVRAGLGKFIATSDPTYREVIREHISANV
jgi:hypothetical protein